MNPRQVRTSARAKINLLLDVGERRTDGYHEVTTIVSTLELSDTLTLEDARMLSLVRHPEQEFAARDDLAMRAVLLLAEELGRPPALALELHKRIPVAAGLGGGSADAAAALVGACALWGVETSAPAVARVARSLGADVPFLIRGGCALCTGRGDEVVRSLPSPVVEIVLVNPGVTLSTAAVYAVFDEEPRFAPIDPFPMAAALESGDVSRVAALLLNDLAEASARVEPSVATVHEFVGSAPGILGAQVAGSGATVFGIARDAASARRAATAASGHGWWSLATRTSPASQTAGRPS